MFTRCSSCPPVVEPVPRRRRVAARVSGRRWAGRSVDKIYLLVPSALLPSPIARLVASPDLLDSACRVAARERCRPRMERVCDMVVRIVKTVARATLAASAIAALVLTPAAPRLRPRPRRHDSRRGAGQGTSTITGASRTPPGPRFPAPQVTIVNERTRHRGQDYQQRQGRYTRGGACARAVPGGNVARAGSRRRCADRARSRSDTAIDVTLARRASASRSS